MAAAWRRPGKEKEQASEEEEEEVEEEERGGGWWEYDSTWEEEDEEGREEKEDSDAAPRAANPEEAKNREKHSWWAPGPRWASSSQRTNGRNWEAARDMQKYRRHYPGLEEIEVHEEEMWNLSFYKNEINFLPRGLFIEDLLETWQDNYVVLEENHSYIQWLFPLREQGMNSRAKQLTCQEIKAFKKSKEVLERFVRAYKLMLGFYGINMLSGDTGELRRAENWCERFENLNRYSHNNLRITRILKCLGEMGFEHYQVQLVKFFLTETLVHQELPRVMRSTLDYFMFTVRNKEKRQDLVHFAWRHFRPKREFVWGPTKKLQRFRPRSPVLLSSPEVAEEQVHAKGGGGKVVGKDVTEPQNGTFQRLPEQLKRETGKEPVGKEKDGLPKGWSVVEPDGHTVRNHHLSEQPVSVAGAKESLSTSDSITDERIWKGATSASIGNQLQDVEAEEPQINPISDCETSRKIHEPCLALAITARTEKEDDKEDSLHSVGPLERKGAAGDSGSGTEGENLKESKKRKHELNKFGDKDPAVSKKPTDIEKISHNLGEVVITKEKMSPLVPKGGDGKSRDRKEAESLDATIKRRKVELAPKFGASPVDLEGQGGSGVTCAVAKVDHICQEEGKRAVNAAADILTECRTSGVGLLVDTKIASENHLPADGSLQEKTKKQGATFVKEGKSSQLPETLLAQEMSLRDNTGSEDQATKETSCDSTGSNEIPKVKDPTSSEAGPEEEACPR